MLILESERQGIQKSKALRTLAGDENFSDAPVIGLDKLKQQEAMRGVWIYEISELEGMNKARVTELKSFLSRQVDSARPAYGHGRVDLPRRGIITGITNDEHYLRDKTGNRRFLPVMVHGVIWEPEAKVMLIDVEGLKRDRDQLWGEACVAEASGEPLNIPEHLWSAAEAEQKARLQDDAWEDVISAALSKLNWNKPRNGYHSLASDPDGKPEMRVSSHWLINDVLSIPKERQRPDQSARIAGVMRSLAWDRPNGPMKIGKATCRGYAKTVLPEVSPSPIEVIPPDRVEILPPVGIRRI
jgi:hypothetical protein